MAFANEHITAYAVEATEFPDLARKYRVNGVPKTVVNDQIEILGGLPQDDFVQQSPLSRGLLSALKIKRLSLSA